MTCGSFSQLSVSLHQLQVSQQGLVLLLQLVHVLTELGLPLLLQQSTDQSLKHKATMTGATSPFTFSLFISSNRPDLSSAWSREQTLLMDMEALVSCSLRKHQSALHFISFCLTTSKQFKEFPELEPNHKSLSLHIRLGFNALLF